MDRLPALIILCVLAGCGAGHIACDLVKWMGRRGWNSAWGVIVMIAMLALCIACISCVI